MRWGSLFSLDSVVKARPHEFAMLFCSIWHPGRAVEGGKGTRWPPIPQCGEGRARLTFPRPSIIVNRLSSRLVVMTGAQSGSRFISFWRRVRAAWQADRRSTTASKSSPPGSCATVATFLTTRQTPRVPSDPHRSSTIDVPQNQARSAKEALELAPTATAWRAGRPEPPAEYGADPESGAHLSHIQLKPQKLLPQIGDK